MTFNEIASGGVSNYGCSIVEYIPYHYIQFAIGDIAYSVPKARIGKLERVAVKKYIYPDLIGEISILYVDSFNAIWNENELTTKEDALVLIDNYSRYIQRESHKIKSC